MSSGTLLEGRELVKTYKRAKNDFVQALRDVSIDLNKGELTAITGPSGSGKTTLLNVLSGLDAPDSGRVLFQEENIVGWPESRLTRFRQLYIGFVFQAWELIPTLNVIENVAMPLLPRKMTTNEIKKAAKDSLEQVLDKLELADGIKNQFPSKISGGQQQRVGIARAIAGEKKIIFADEPTGSLDVENGKKVMKVLKKLADKGTAVVVVTHDVELVKGYAKKMYKMSDGELSKY